MIPLGPFQLDAPLGEGGMGTVWSGRHHSGTAVAVKVLSASTTPRPRMLSAFRREVRAIAALEHPGIVHVFEHGEIPAEAARLSDGAFRAGAPFLVMELAEGTLADVLGRLPWDTTRSVLFQLLDALAHAHARGVIHRDLKPANVLINRDSRGLYRVRLTDFGLVWVRERSHVQAGICGTPQYMAPEQYHASWRNFAPTTDLYALGCVAWALVCGAPPFSARSVNACGELHLSADPPALAPAMPVPPGLEAWLRRLLQKDPRHRFACAADAAWALGQLSAQTTAEPPTVQIRASSSHTLMPDSDWSSETAALTWTGMTRVKGALPPPLPPQSGLPARQAPPLPPSWRALSVPPLPPRLRDAGLGLLELRTVPVLGRDPELRALWSALERVHGEGSPGHVRVVANPGLGATRLVAEIALRAEAFGVAWSVHIRCGQAANGPVDALARAVAQRLGCERLEGAELIRRLEWLFPRASEGEQHAIAAVMHPSERQGLEVRGAGLTCLAAQLCVAGLDSRQRAGVIVLDDLDRAPELLTAVAPLLASRLPVLVLSTTHGEVLKDYPDQQLSLGPLDPLLIGRQVRELLGLSGELAAAVEHRSAGSPAYAAVALGRLAARGALLAEPLGYVLAEGASIDLPSDLFGLWAQRVDEALDPLTLRQQVAVERAAVVGGSVSTTRWQGLCSRHTPEELEEVGDILRSSGLAQAATDALRFAQPLVNRVIVERSERAGRLQAHHAACAKALATEGARSGELARHLLRAGQPQLARDVLLADIQRLTRWAGGPQVRLEQVCMEETIDTLGDQAGEELKLLRALSRAVHALGDGDFKEFGVWAPSAWDLAERLGSPVAQSRLARALGEVHRQQFRDEEAESAFQGAIALCAELEDDVGWGESTLSLAMLRRRQHRLEEAEALASAALERFKAAGWNVGHTGALRTLGVIASRRMDFPQARALWEEVLERCVRDGMVLGQANVLNDLGSLAQSEQRLDQAEGLFQQAARAYIARGSYARIYPEYNLALLALHRGRFANAASGFEALLPEVEALDLQPLLGGIYACLACCHASRGAWQACALHLELADAHLSRSSPDDSDAWPCDVTGALAAKAGQTALARSAWGMAARIWHQIDKSGEAERVERLSARLEAE